jgi:hypothetical protein
MRANYALLALTLIGLAGCGGDGAPPSGEAAEAAPAPREVHFTASDFAFEGPRTIESGMITFALTNTSETWHHLQLIRLPEGMTMEEFGAGLMEMQPGSPIPTWVVAAGGVNPPPTGGTARVTLMVEPGEYAVLCLVDTPDKVPHVAKGMIQPLTVTASASAPAPLPASDLTLTLVDYAFSFSEPLTSGAHVVRVENSANQEHEIALFRFLPGKGMADLEAWAVAYEGPAPMTAIGGVPAIRPGQVADMYLDLTSGDYVALCFVPDATDGMLHLMHGMVLPFQIS